MLSRLRHRGQDGEMLFETDGVTIGACKHNLQKNRTSPSMVVEDDMAVAADSYLFNRDALQLNLLGRVDPEVSDSQLVLDLFKRMGISALNYLNGAFTISIIKGNELILARDRYGLKPMYISLDEEIGSYSSEMKSQYITDEDFRPFPPGTIFSTVNGFQGIIPKVVRNYLEVDNEDTSLCLRALIERSIKQCANQSQSVNILLSGGLDSSIIAAATAQHWHGIHTLCVGVEGCEDLDMARKVAESLGTDHTERTYDVDEMVEVLEKVIYSLESFDLPLVRSSIPNYLATHAFSEKSCVTLCGEGADEIFGGYDHMVELDDESLRSERNSLLLSGHLTGFQRVDRMTSSASLDGRMPFMDPAIIAYGLKINAKDLVDGVHGLSKISLRRAYMGILPEEVAQRRKKRFSDGAGSIEAMQNIAEHAITDVEFERERSKVPMGRIRNKEELMYYRIFKEYFDTDSCMKAVGLTPRI